MYYNVTSNINSSCYNWIELFLVHVAPRYKMSHGDVLTWKSFPHHYDDVIMGTIASHITSLPGVYSTVYSGADQNKHQSSASLAFVWGIHRGPVNSPHKCPVTRKMFPFDDVIMQLVLCHWINQLMVDSLYNRSVVVLAFNLIKSMNKQWTRSL